MRYHTGIGMIQVPWQDGRLHIWHPDWRATRPDSSMHSHKFSFSSRILKGQIINRIVAPIAGEEYRLWRSYREPQEPKLLGPVGLVTLNVDTYWSGDEYFMEAGRFHETRMAEDQLVVTFMKKAIDFEEMPVYVISGKDTKLENAFSGTARRPSTEEMTKIVDDVLKVLL